MKKFLLISICFLLLVGCARVTKTNTLVGVYPYISDITNIETLPVTADLVVSEQKIRGEATGQVTDLTNLGNLEKEALANALGQNPPSIDKPDVLVGMNLFTEIEGAKLKVIVTGYPAYYANFRTATEVDSLRLNVVNNNSGTSP